MDGIGIGNPKGKLTPARAGGSERNAGPAITKARTTSFFIIKETRKIYPRIQETVRGANRCREKHRDCCRGGLTRSMRCHDHHVAERPPVCGAQLAYAGCSLDLGWNIECMESAVPSYVRLLHPSSLTTPWYLPSPIALTAVLC